MANITKKIFTLLLLWSYWLDSAAQLLMQAGTNDANFNIADNFSGFNSTVFSLALQPDGKVLVGGQFTSFNGTACNYIVRLNADGSLDPSFNPGAGFNATVLSLALQPDGKVLVGGWFTSFNGTACNYIARLNADGSLDIGFNPSGSGLSAAVSSIALQTDGKVLVGGWFTSFNGTFSSRIARLNVDGSLDASFAPGAGFNNTVESIALQPDGKLLVGGWFTSFDGTSRSRIARLNVDGSLDTGFDPGAGFNNWVYSLALQPDGKWLIGGVFTSFDGTSRNRITRLNADGSLDIDFNPGTGLNNTVESIALQSDGKILLGGAFTSFNGTNIHHIARLNTDGSLDTGFDSGTGFNNTVVALALQPDGKVVVGGFFTAFNGGIARNRIARLNVDGTLDTSIYSITGFNNIVYSLALQPDGKVIVGGEFNSFGSTTCNRIARLNMDGSFDTSFDPSTGFNNTVEYLVLQPDGKLIVGGQFTSFNSVVRNRIARLNADGSLDTSFDPGAGFQGSPASVRFIVLQPDGKIVVGGNFTSFDGIARNRIARLNADGSLDTSFDPGIGFNNWVYSLALQPDGKIVVGGNFTSFDGTSRNRIARLNADGGLDASFNPGTGFDNWVYSLALQPDGKIIMGGNFASFNEIGRNRIARLNTDGSLDASFNPGAGVNGFIYTLLLQPYGRVIIGGSFTSFDGKARNRIARLNADGSLDTDFDPGAGFNNWVYTLVRQADGNMIMGGNFTSFDGKVRNHIVRVFIFERIPQTINFEELAARSFGDAPFPLLATASSGLPVRYSSSNASVATIAGNTVTIVGAGTTTITASQAGDANFNVAIAVARTLTINKANQNIVFGTLTARNLTDAPFLLTAAASSGLPVSYVSSNADVATISGNLVTIVGVGTTDIIASQAGNINFNAASNVIQTLAVDFPVITNTTGFNNTTQVLYPNPATSEVNWVIPNRTGHQYGYVFYDNQGRALLSGQGTVTDELLHWDVVSLPTGVYTLRLQIGSEIFSKNIVKQ